MDLFTQITEDIKEAMKAQQKERLSALRMLKSALIENRTATAPRAELDVVISHVKKLRDAIDSFPAGDSNRQKIEEELKHLNGYMPQSMEQAEVVAAIDTILTRLEKPNMGAIMKELTPLIKGRFDGKVASQLVQDALQTHAKKE